MSDPATIDPDDWRRAANAQSGNLPPGHTFRPDPPGVGYVAPRSVPSPRSRWHQKYLRGITPLPGSRQDINSRDPAPGIPRGWRHRILQSRGRRLGLHASPVHNAVIAAPPAPWWRRAFAVVSRLIRA